MIIIINIIIISSSIIIIITILLDIIILYDGNCNICPFCHHLRDIPLEWARSNVNMSIKWSCTTSYLMTRVVFVLSLTFYEIIANKIN